MWLLACAVEQAGSTDSAASLPVDSPASIDTGPWGEARTDVADCAVGTRYDDDADGVIDRWTDIAYDSDERWSTEGFDDGTYLGTLTATWEGDCLAHIDGSFVDDDTDQWTLTINQTCDTAGNVTKRVEVWDQDFHSGGGSVYGHTTEGEYGYDERGRLISQRLSDDGWTTADAEAWTYGELEWPETAEVDWYEDGAIDQRWAWTWDADGDVLTETLNDATDTYERDGRDRLVAITGSQQVQYVYAAPSADRPLLADGGDWRVYWLWRCD